MNRNMYIARLCLQRSRIPRIVTNGPSAPMPSVEPPFAHPRTSRPEPTLNYQSSKTIMTVNQDYE